MLHVSLRIVWRRNSRPDHQYFPDLHGQKKEILVHEEQLAGKHEIQWQAGNSIPGIYFYSVNTNTERFTGKMLVAP